MATEFTRYRLRERAEKLGIAVRYGQFRTYIAKGLLPDPNEEPWVEEQIVPRFLRIHQLESTARSLDRRVVILYLERYPVSARKLQCAMAGMIKTMTSPARKMARVGAADRWFGDQFGSPPIWKEDVLPRGWKPPKPSAWGDLLCQADLRVFEHRLGIVQYHMWQLATLGKGTAHALVDLPAEEALVLLTVRFLAGRDWIRKQAQERRESNKSPSWLLPLTAEVDQRSQDQP